MYCSKFTGITFCNFTKKKGITIQEFETAILKFHTFELLRIKNMKALKIIIMILAISVALYEQVSPKKNIYIIVIAIAVFMYGMMQLSAKTPSKNQDKEENDVD